jgi:hypothetical protein
MNDKLIKPFYYLENFGFVLDWVARRYGDLLLPDEADFISKFQALPLPSQALLVRMVMRKGSLFRERKLVYREIGEPRVAAQSLIKQGWVLADPTMTLDQLFAVLTKSECVRSLGLAQSKSAAKDALLESARQQFPDARRFSEWAPGSDELVYELGVGPLCDRFRLMFFGNLYQDWSEFVLADLGIYTYEKVPISDSSRAFHSRRDLDFALHLHACRERLHAEQALEQIEHDLGAYDSDHRWLRSRRAKLLFQIGQRYEQQDDRADALRIYAQCSYPGARGRHIRVLEKDGQTEAALELAQQAAAAPESDAEAQLLARMLPRLLRKRGLSRRPQHARTAPSRFDLNLPRPQTDHFVEDVVRAHLQQAGAGAESEAGSYTVHYVENALINSLLGLLCWDAIFHVLPGAFFHPFQTGPADLHSADFYPQRSAQFQACLAQLDSGQYKQTMRENFVRKAGIESPFVYWQVLTEALLEQALTCLPAAHLAKWFARILADIPANRSGFPDLIEFWPEQQRYRMIEVKGPGDRLQDNQIRLLDYCIEHGMPVAVCHVAWLEAAP